MPSDLVRSIDLDMLFPAFRDKVLDLLANCRARGCDYKLTSGYRSYSDQMKLWQIGRTSLGGKVTNAKGGQSAHNFGIAVDCMRLKGSKGSWVVSDYDVLGEEAAKLGLHWGKAYKDVPHIALSGFVSGADLRPLDVVYQQTSGQPIDKLKKVWERIEHGL